VQYSNPSIKKVKIGERNVPEIDWDNLSLTSFKFALNTITVPFTIKAYPYNSRVNLNKAPRMPRRRPPSILQGAS